MKKLYKQLRGKRLRNIGQSVPGLFVAGSLIACILFAGLTHAAGEISQVETTDQPGTPTRYSIDGTTYTWGMGTNQVIESFSSHGKSYQYSGNADRVELVRHDMDNVSTGNPCGVFVERLGASSEVLKANYPSDGSDTGNCDMAAMLASRVVNRGALNLFSNSGPNPKNVERVDYVYDHGVLAPLTTSALSLSGHVVAEKSGNNPLQIAAITELDIFGQPAAFGPLVMVDRNSCSGETICYGITNLRHNYSFFQNNSFAPQGYPSFLQNSTEPVGMAFVSLDKLGLNAGQVYYGYAYFADDVDASIHTLTDVSTFPSDTNDEKIVFGDGPDIYGGAAGYFLGAELSVASGAVFKDENGDGVLNEDEAGMANIGLTLFKDTNGNGVFDQNDDTQIGPMFDTDANGEFRIPGLEDGVYFLLLDESDDDLPPGISVVPGSNPAMIVIQGNDADGIGFGFVSDNGPVDDGTDAGDTSGSDADAGDTSGTDADAGDTSGSDADAGDTSGSDADAGDTSGSDADAGDTSGSDADAGDTSGSDADAGDTSGSDADAGATGGGTDTGNNGDALEDAVTEALPDSASVTQGSSVTIDVLANDTDQAGQGLTIVGEPTSTNATIVVKDGEIIYTPDFGFIGMDAFLYTIEDAAGVQSTGTVSVNVLRYSDINNNGKNDFDECDCENLTIEVGIEGSALGGSSWLSVIVLALLIGVRRVFRIRRGENQGVLK